MWSTRICKKRWYNKYAVIICWYIILITWMSHESWTRTAKLVVHVLILKYKLLHVAYLDSGSTCLFRKAF